MEPIWHPDGIKNRWQLRKAIFSRDALSLQRGLVLQDQEGRNWEQKWSKNGAKNEVNKAKQLVIDFLSIFVDLRAQVGRENRAKNRSKKVLKIFEDLDGQDVAKKGILVRSWGESGAAPGRNAAHSGRDAARSENVLAHLGVPLGVLTTVQLP